MAKPHRRHDTDMTEGSIAGNIIRFTIPLLLGNLFQQLYNMVDTWVIGQTGENGAYAAVGSVGPIINILIGFFLGLSSGAGVVISQYYGAKDDKNVKESIHTSVLMTLIMGVLFTVIGIVMTPLMLRLMLHTDSAADSVYPFAKTYLTIYFAGVIGLMIYNMGAGILRAVGDSRRPFIFLVVSAVTNTVLDLLFVFGFDMGVAGVALATIIAQFLSAVLVIIVLLRSDGALKLTLRELRLNFKILGKIFRVGIPAALQMAVTAFSNVFVQSYVAGVNGLKEFCLGGWTTYTKVEQFIFLPIQSIALAATTFVGQNYGCGNYKRARRGTYVSYGIATGVTVCVIIIVELLTNQLSGIFNPDENVIFYSNLLLRYLTPFYLLCCVNQVFASSLRGVGNAAAPMIIMLSSFVVFRQIYLFVVTNYISNELLPVAASYPAGWFVCAVTMLIYFKCYKFGEDDDKLKSQ